jgi:hypothetical protein
MQMSYASLRRVSIPSMDRKVTRTSMQINNAKVMQDLYVSRADPQEQWIVVSNPSEKNIDLTGFSITDDRALHVFRFPQDYILLAGQEVTVWCTPGSVNFNPKNLIDPYLFWLSSSNGLSSTPFFTRQPPHEIILLDPFLTEVASLQLTSRGQKTFRVNGTAPYEQQKGFYIFSRYWDVMSDTAFMAHYIAVAIIPLVITLSSNLCLIFICINSSKHVGFS